MKKILLILVGGTICTALNEHGTLSISEGAGIKLIENFKSSGSPFKEDVEIIPTENLFILSENMSIPNWNLILDTYRKHLNTDNFDGVIFAHGTDTLAYSTSLFSLILANTDIPVFFVSSNARLDLERANGNDNFRYAVELICKGIEPNVYATYKNISDGRMYLHLGSRLEQCRNYSEDFFSQGAIDITEISDEIIQKVNELSSQGKTPLLFLKNGTLIGIIAVADSIRQGNKEAVKQRSKEILKGKSAVGKVWDVLTDGHKIQAEIEVGLERRGYD